MTSSKETLAMATVLEHMPEVKKILKSHGHKVGENWIAPKAIASLTMMAKLLEKGVSFDKVAETLNDCLTANQFITVKVDKDTEEIEERADYKTRLHAVKLFVQMMGIDKGFDVPIPIESLPTEQSVVKVSLRRKESDDSFEDVETS